MEWFNLVDGTYRSEIRELFGANFGRFDAKLEQRIAELRAEFERRSNALEAKLEQRIAELRADLVVQFERRIAALDAKLEQRAAALGAESREGLATLEGRLLARMGVLEGRFGILEGRLVRWMFAFWAASVATTVALILLTR